MTTTAAADGPPPGAANGAGGPPLSKSQRKRMKQKASRARREAEREAAEAAGELVGREGQPPQQQPQRQQRRRTSSDGSSSSFGDGGGGGDHVAGAAAATSASAAKPGTAALNPHDRIRSEVAARGYSLPEVDAALEEMWERGMRYDDPDRVSEYLASGGTGGGGAAKAADNGGIGNGAHHPEFVKAAPSRDSVRTAATSQSTRIESPISPAGPPGGGGEAIEEAAEETKSDGGDGDGDGNVGVGVGGGSGGEARRRRAAEQPRQQPHASSTTSSGARRRKKKSASAPAPPAAAPMDLMARLELVANSDDLGDAVFALTEWVSKAAKPEEISDLCNSHKSRALPTVLRRAAASSGGGDDDVGGVLILVESILVACGSDASHASAASSALGAALAGAARLPAAAEAETVKTNAASVLADRTVAALSRTVDRLRFASVDDGEAAIRTIEEEIDAMASSIPPSSGGEILSLMTRRDCHRVAAEKSSSVVGIAVASAARTADSAAAVAAASAGPAGPGGRDALVSSLLGHDLEATVGRNRSEYENLRSELDLARSSSSEERAALVSELDGYRAERDDVAGRIDALRAELDGLERRHAELGTKVTDVEGRLDGLDADLDEGVRDIKARLSERSGLVKLGEAVGSLANGIEEVEGTIAKSYDAAAKARGDDDENEEGGMTPERVSNKMGIYFVRVFNYFKAEADCVEFMVKRAAALESGLADLEREIEECKALGMTTNVAQMTQSLKETKRNIAEDKGVVVALRGEADKMRDDFMVRLDEYKATRGNEAQTNQAQTSLQLSVLSGIRDAMSRIGMDDGGLREYIDSVAADASVPLQDTSLSESQIKEHFGEDNDDSEEAKDDAEEGGDIDGGSATAVSGAALPLQVPPPDASNAAAEATPDPAAKAVAPPPASPAMVMPKLSWAASAAPKKAAGKSLLEIQQEELSAKEAES